MPKNIEMQDSFEYLQHFMCINLIFTTPPIDFHFHTISLFPILISFFLQRCLDHSTLSLMPKKIIDEDQFINSLSSSKNYQLRNFNQALGSKNMKQYNLGLKSSRNKKVLNDVTAATFSVFFCCWKQRKRHRKRTSCDVINVLLIL